MTTYEDTYGDFSGPRMSVEEVDAMYRTLREQDRRNGTLYGLPIDPATGWVR